MSRSQCLHFFSVANYLILFKFADKEEMHNILDVFEFWPDWTTATEELVALEHPKIPNLDIKWWFSSLFTYFRTIKHILSTCLLSG